MVMGIGASDEVLAIKTEVGDFLVLGMTGHEHLGRLYEYSVELAGAVNLLGIPADVDLFKLLGTRATLTMKVEDDPRYFDGYVTRARRGEKRGRYDTYTLTLQPWLWFATQTKNSRVFQETSVKDIVTEVLKDYSTDSEWRLASEGDYPKLDYCIQYAETDFNFVSRLLEEVGIYYFFEHTKGKHMMVLVDAMSKHKSREDTSALKWSNALQTDATIMNWTSQEEARSVKAVLTEYDYLAPATEIKGEKKADPPPPPAGGLAAGAAAAVGLGGGAGGAQKMLGSMEWFEHPAYVVQNGVKLETTSAATAVTKRATVRMEELATLYSSATGVTNARDFGIGASFELDGAPTASDNQKYLMVSAIYRLDFADHEAVSDLKSETRHEGYRCDFLAISLKAPNYRSPRVSPRPVIAGPQTALVVGASGNEIETDKHGRIKVQFFWDRLGKKDQNSSCWVRCAMPWAGKGFGMFTLPRMGDEVVVQFLDGDPDRPLVMGSVYNNVNTPPWKLPLRNTAGGIKSRSSMKGEPENANELRFEDKKGEEHVWFQAEKDYFRTVKNDAFDYVGNNETVKVELTRKEAIGQNWFLDVTDDVMHNLGKDLHVNVAGDIFYTGGATFQLKLEKDLNAKIGADLGIEVAGKTQLKVQDDILVHSIDGKISIKSGNTPTTGSDVLVQGANVNIKAGGSVLVEAMTAISFKVGSSVIKISMAGVDIAGTLVSINCGGSAEGAKPGLAANPVAPTDAKKEDTITPEKKDDYDKNFDDPFADDASAAS